MKSGKLRFLLWVILLLLVTGEYSSAAPSLGPQASPPSLSGARLSPHTLLPTHAEVETTKGPFTIQFEREVAPVTVQNFVELAQKGFYQGLMFHKYQEYFIIQGGDPQGDGKGGPGYTLPAELSALQHQSGTVGMAQKPWQVNPERRSNGSQFYITLGRALHLDGQMTVFGKVIEGFDAVVMKLRKGDKIIRIRPYVSKQDGEEKSSLPPR